MDLDKTAIDLFSEKVNRFLQQHIDTDEISDTFSHSSHTFSASSDSEDDNNFTRALQYPFMTDKIKSRKVESCGCSFVSSNEFSPSSCAPEDDDYFDDSAPPSIMSSRRGSKQSDIYRRNCKDYYYYHKKGNLQRANSVDEIAVAQVQKKEEPKNDNLRRPLNDHTLPINQRRRFSAFTPGTQPTVKSNGFFKPKVKDLFSMWNQWRDSGYMSNSRKSSLQTSELPSTTK